MSLANFRHALFRRLTVLRRSESAYCLAVGCLSGCYVLNFCHQLMAMLGMGLAVTTGIGCALAGGASLGLRDTAGRAVSRRRSVTAFALLHFGLAAATVGLPWLLELVLAIFQHVSLNALSRPGIALLLAVPATLLIVGVPTFWMARIPIILHRCRVDMDGSKTNESRADRLSLSATTRLYLIGVLGGLLTDVFVLAPLVGVQIAAFSAAIVGGCLFLRGIALRDWETAACRAEPPTSGGSAGASPSRNRVLKPLLAEYVWTISAVVCCGALTAAVLRMLQQLLPVAGFVVYVEWSSLLAGVLLGWSLSERRFEPNGTTHKIRACLGLVTWSVILLAVFPWMMDVSLAMSSNLSSVWLMMAARSLLVLLVVLPLGMGWGMLASVRHNCEADGTRSISGAKTRPSFIAAACLPDLHPVAFVVGHLIVLWVGLRTWGVSGCFIASLWLLLALALAGWFQSRFVVRGWIAKGAAIAAVCLTAVVPYLATRYNPAQSAKLLFATNVFLANRTGLDRRKLLVIDEGRQLAQTEGNAGTYTLWKYRGAQLQLRESGVPIGVTSIDPGSCPQFSAEVMPAVVPLVLHESPRRVLLLGLGGGVGVTTCLSFPVQQLTCVERDARLIDLVRREIWSPSDNNPDEDGRLRLLPLDPVLAVSGRDAGYDVIISNPRQSASMQSTANFTVEFYTRAARRLARDGIFCQRFQQVDYGPQPLQVAVRSIQAAFETVMALEIAAGEIVLIGTNSPHGLIRGKLLSRLKAGHVRRVLSELGWDWSVVVKLAAYDDAALAEFSSDGQAAPNTTQNGLFTFRLPQEMMRWGLKWSEIQTALSGRQSWMLNWAGEEADDPNVRRRLTEVATQQRLMVQSQAEWRLYRKAVRQQLKSPKTILQQVSHQDPKHVLHPDEKRRKQYCSALSVANSRKTPQSADIRVLAKFAVPFDPLISYFLHQEAAELYARSADGDVQSEFRHRVHTIYFADSRDRSIQNVVAAVMLLVEHPETVSEPIARWDHLNALLQVLKVRWDARGAIPPSSSSSVLSDIEASIRAMESAFSAMDALSQQCGPTVASWPDRRQYLERVVVRPLRTYRGRILSHHRRKRRQSEE